MYSPSLVNVMVTTLFHPLELGSATICLRRSGGGRMEDDQENYEEGAGNLTGNTATKKCKMVETVSIMRCFQAVEPR